MSSVLSTTNTQAVQGLVQRTNQIVLDGTVAAVLDTGEVFVKLQDATQGLFCPAVIDHKFEVGESVMVARANDGNFILFGLGSSKTINNPGQSLQPARAPLTISSQNLHEAVLRLVDKQNQILRASDVVAILADGALVLKIGPTPVLARAASNQRFEVGQKAYALRQDDGEYLVLGTVA